ncbi:PoNe immunity protein domain-containing protein [Pseudomonas purpurea]|uniref:PoNe immunity protein domain-containing protein n=1 Tax=Pseudomonas purpurea TaxID=3136737 RepID=UPI003265AC01
MKSTRQRFLTEQRLSNFHRGHARDVEFARTHLFEADSPEQEQSLKAGYFQEAALDEILIRYTAGEAIDSLSPYLEVLIDTFEHYREKLAIYEQVPDVAPLDIASDLFHYETCVQVISLCVLLLRADLLKRFVALFDNAGFAGDDTLYEDLLNKVLPGRHDVDEWHHEHYSPLVHAVYEEEPAEASQLLQHYCDSWYDAFEHAPWHDTHLMGDRGSYVGYWALEAAAIAFLYDIDDSQVDCWVYPKDLVEYARNYSR